MTDNITLPRAVVEQVREALLSFDNWWDDEADTALTALDAALAEPPAAREPVAWMESPHGAIRANPLYRITAPQSLAWSIPLYTHLPAASPEPDAKPEPATDEQIVKAGGECAVVDDEYLLDFRDGWHEAERFHGIRKEDKT